VGGGIQGRKPPTRVQPGRIYGTNVAEGRLDCVQIPSKGKAGRKRRERLSSGLTTFKGIPRITDNRSTGGHTESFWVRQACSEKQRKTRGEWKGTVVSSWSVSGFEPAVQ